MAPSGTSSATRYPPLWETANSPPEKVLTKDQLIDILHELERLPDYWADYEGEVLVPGVRCTNGFKSVERLCEIIELYDQITDKGWEIVFYYG